MNPKTVILAMVLLPLLSRSADAANVYECIDAAGKTTFSDHCPPGSRKKETLFHTDASAPSPQEAEPLPVVLYSVARCDACDLVRNFLNKHRVPFTEKDVTENQKLQEEIREKAGSVTVPFTFIGDKALRGYDSYALSDAIAAAGYSPDEQPLDTDRGSDAVGAPVND